MIPHSIQELQTYNVNLAIRLNKHGYKIIAANDSIPYCSYKDNYCYTQHLDYLQQSNNANTNVCIIVDNFIVLDVDTDAEFTQLKQLSEKYNCKSNQIVKTRNGYHVYYAVDYPVKAQSNIDNRIAVKCNGMPITAPESYRHSKKHLYSCLYGLKNSTENKLQLLPEAMYNELRPVPKITPAPVFVNSSHNYNYDKYNLSIAEYLSMLDVNTYLLGEKIPWLRVLAACKATGAPDAYSACFNWSKQGKYSKMTAGEFEAQWISSTGITNGYGWLNSVTKGRV